MKNEKFQLRISEQDRAALDELAHYYNLSASSVICMLIAKDFREKKEGVLNGIKPV